jgi:hypothetical protein
VSASNEDPQEFVSNADWPLLLSNEYVTPKVIANHHHLQVVEYILLTE